MTAVDQSALLIPSAPTERSPSEAVPIEEAEAIATISRGIAQIVRNEAVGKPARRDAHPKAHGCVEAEFRVLDGLSANLAVGLFATPRVYPAWIRFSNASSAPRPDKVGDGRGAAIKVMGVEGSRSGTQDFVMFNAPRFLVRNALDYVAFQAAIATPLKFFFPSFNPFGFRLHELFAGMEITGGKPANPVALRYWSATPYLMGETACKFSILPVGPTSSNVDRVEPGFMRENLVKTLSDGEAAFDFCVQLRAASMPVEDPTITWSEAASPFIPVARVTIPRQVFDTPERIAFGENLSFTPWHGLDAHRPLGGINRVRRTVYEAVSTLRHELNDQQREA